MSISVICRTACAIVMVALAGEAMATDDNVPTTKGFSGNVLFGAGYIDLESNLFRGNKLLDVSNETINTVNDSPDSNNDTFPVITGEVDYTFGDRWQVFLGSDVGDLATLDFSQRLGIRKQWDQVGVFGLALLFTGAPAEVWQDPYLTGTPRSDTDRDSTGVRLDWWKILDSGFFLQLKTRKIDVKDEASGTDPALGLSPGEIALLRRDGDDSRLTVGYRWKDGRNLWQPEITAGQNDRDGDAMNADVVGFQLTYSYLGELWTMVATGGYSQSSYDKANPVYGKKIDSDAYTLGFTAIRKLDFGDGNWRLFGTVAYADDNSDVNFHDSTASSIILGGGYSFGRK